MHNLTLALLLGCLFVVLSSVCSCSSGAAPLISLVTIPLSLLTASLLPGLRAATTINTMILAGFVIARGVVVDDAIIDIENRGNSRAGASAPAAIRGAPAAPGAA